MSVVLSEGEAFVLFLSVGGIFRREGLDRREGSRFGVGCVVCVSECVGLCV